VEAKHTRSAPPELSHDSVRRLDEQAAADESEHVDDNDEGHFDPKAEVVNGRADRIKVMDHVDGVQAGDQDGDST
jgi:hypothetical protein